MEKLSTPSPNGSYKELYDKYESLIKDMRVYWEENYGTEMYFRSFNERFSGDRFNIERDITNTLLQMKASTLSANIEINSLQKISKDLEIHYQVYWVGDSLFELIYKHIHSQSLLNRDL